MPLKGIQMAKITIYSAQNCVYCQRAEQLLKLKGVDHLNKILVDTAPDQLEKMIEKTGRRTVPQIFIGNVHIGGFDDLAALDKSRELDQLLKK